MALKLATDVGKDKITLKWKGLVTKYLLSYQKRYSSDGFMRWARKKTTLPKSIVWRYNMENYFNTRLRRKVGRGLVRTKKREIKQRYY